MTAYRKQASKGEGKITVGFSDKSGSSVAIEFSSTTQENATAVMGICASTLGSKPDRVVTSDELGNTSSIHIGGGGSMDKRLSVLESEVAHIKGDVFEIKKSVSAVEKTVNSVDKNMAVLMVKIDNITDSLSKKPSSDAVDKKISDAKFAILLGVPAIIGIVTAVAKAIQYFYFTP